MDAIIKSLETTLSEQTAMMRILQSNQSAAAVSNAQHLIFGASQQQQQQQQQQQHLPEFEISARTRTLTPTQQQQQQQAHARQLSHLGVSPAAMSAATTPIFSHGKQLSTPATATVATAGNAATSSDLLRSLALSPMLRPPSQSPQAVAAAAAASTAELLHRPQPRLSSQLVMGSTPPQQQQHFLTGEGIPRNLSGVQLTPKELLRSATPTADAFRRSVTPVGLVERLAASGPSGRRDSAPGVVLGGSAGSSAAAAIRTNTSTGAT